MHGPGDPEGPLALQKLLRPIVTPDALSGSHRKTIVREPELVAVKLAEAADKVRDHICLAYQPELPSGRVQPEPQHPGPRRQHLHCIPEQRGVPSAAEDSKLQKERKELGLGAAEAANKQHKVKASASQQPFPLAVPGSRLQEDQLQRHQDLLPIRTCLYT